MAAKEKQKAGEQNGTITKEQAQQVLQASVQADAQACLDEIRAICEKYGATLIATAYLTPDGRIEARLSHLAIQGRVIEIR